MTVIAPYGQVDPSSPGAPEGGQTPAALGTPEALLGHRAAAPGGHLQSVTRAAQEVDAIGLFAAARELDLEVALWLQPAAGFALVGIGRAWSVEASGGERFRRAAAAWQDLHAGAAIDVPPGSPRGIGPVLLGGLGFTGELPADVDPWGPFGAASLVLPELTYARAHGASFVTVAEVGSPAGRTAARRRRGRARRARLGCARGARGRAQPGPRRRGRPTRRTCRWRWWASGRIALPGTGSWVSSRGPSAGAGSTRWCSPVGSTCDRRSRSTSRTRCAAWRQVPRRAPSTRSCGAARHSSARPRSGSCALPGVISRRSRSRAPHGAGRRRRRTPRWRPRSWRAGRSARSTRWSSRCSATAWSRWRRRWRSGRRRGSSRFATSSTS